MQEEKIKCDVLVAGGGIAGLMAAIKAREMGASVVVAEKSNTLRSGAAGAGNDHFQCYIPEVHGDFEFFWKELGMGMFMGREHMRYWFENTFEMVKLWDSWGIPMKYEGRYEFAGHGFPGKQLNHLKYSGMNQKPVLTKQARDRGVEIINRVMVFDLLQEKDGSVIGAIGASTREDKTIVFEAKAVVLATGGCQRMYPGTVAGADYVRGYPVTITGDGRVMAYHAGSELMNPEWPHIHAGAKYFYRVGQATWIGVLKDRSGKIVGPYLTKPDRYLHDMTIQVNTRIFDEYNKSGRGPIYMDMNGITKDDLDYMIYWLKNEGNLGLLNYIKEENIDLSKMAVEFQTAEMNIEGGIRTNTKGETSVKGLYAAGDEVFATISHAAVYGWSAGDSAAKYAKAETAQDIEQTRTNIDEKKAFLEEIRNRKDGARWQEAIAALQQMMYDYCGNVRSESLLGAGLDIIRRLRDKARSTLMAENAHELMHCLQVLNLIDIGEIAMVGAYDRKETRAAHIRTDYTLTDPLLASKMHLVKQVDGKPATEWLDVSS